MPLNGRATFAVKVGALAALRRQSGRLLWDTINWVMPAVENTHTGKGTVAAIPLPPETVE
jgi:hypothetical protein